jgi:RNase adaptor protein for sRNA GlmZ degradation
MDELTVTVLSFGYMRSGVPADASGNGGGFVFDCRCLPNPAWEEGFMHLCGLDERVRDWLGADSGTVAFLDSVFAIVDLAIDAFFTRGFTALQVSFGCTGGQHRSVYCSERLAEHLRAKGVCVDVIHTERGKWWE